MPFKKAVQRRDNPPAREQEGVEAPARQRVPEPAEDRTAAHGRPFRDYVEHESKRYWQYMVNKGGLTKPDRQEIRRAAMQIHLAAQHRRTGWSPLIMAHHAVAAMHLHAAVKGWVRQPYSRPAAMPDYHEALIQLADDADWLLREVPLPAHPGPQHPVIYYTIDEKTKQPVPRADAKMRADYVYDPQTGIRLSAFRYIQPWQDLHKRPSQADFLPRQCNVFFALARRSAAKDVEVFLYIYDFMEPDDPVRTELLSKWHFSPYQPVVIPDDFDDWG